MGIRETTPAEEICRLLDELDDEEACALVSEWAGADVDRFEVVRTTASVGLRRVGQRAWRLWGRPDGDGRATLVAYDADGSATCAIELGAAADGGGQVDLVVLSPVAGDARERPAR